MNLREQIHELERHLDRLANEKTLICIKLHQLRAECSHREDEVSTWFPTTSKDIHKCSICGKLKFLK